MNMESASFLWGAIAFLVFFSAALLLLRVRGNAAPVPRLALLGLLVHGAAVISAWLAYPGLPYWHGAALYWFLFNSFLFAFSAVYKSVSLRILWELQRAGRDGIPMNEITERHVAPLFRERIDILVQGGMASSTGNRYEITPKGRTWANRFALVQKICGIERGGLYGGQPPTPSGLPADRAA